MYSSVRTHTEQHGILDRQRKQNISFSLRKSKVCDTGRYRPGDSISGRSGAEWLYQQTGPGGGWRLDHGWKLAEPEDANAVGDKIVRLSDTRLYDQRVSPLARSRMPVLRKPRFAFYANRKEIFAPTDRSQKLFDRFLNARTGRRRVSQRAQQPS
jgi:hypothetical protein